MNPDVGRKVIEIARSLIGCHYINGAYGATPGLEDGCPCRPGGIKLIADPSRLNPAKSPTPSKNLAVFAAEMTVKKYCVCAGNYALHHPREISPTDPDLVNYLSACRGGTPATWPTYNFGLTPRRAYGPGPGGDVGGTLVWGQSCKGIRHFDCVGFISFCIWKATGRVMQLEISGWRTPNTAGAVFNLKSAKPASLMDGDILVQADHHIGFVDKDGTVFEAQDTHLGVRASGRFSLGATGSWSHLVRVGAAATASDQAWPLGWWKVWDGKTYFYYFGPNGVAQYTKTSPSNLKAPPKVAINTGRYTISPPNTMVVTWKQVAGASKECQETYYNAAPGCTQMNANSNLYGPLVASRMN